MSARTAPPAAGESAVPTAGGNRGFTLLIALSASVGGLLYGYDTGIIGSALLYLKGPMGIADNTFVQSAVTAITLLGAIFGALLTGPVSDRMGRRPTTMLVAVLFIVFAVGCGVAPDLTTLLVMRFLLGLAVGGASQIVPVYIAELAPPAVRGAQTSLFQVMICVGTLLAYLSGHLLGPSHAWRWMLALAAVPALLFLIGMAFLPESPRWLLSRGREAQARAVLARVRSSAAEVDAEIADIKGTFHAEQGSWRELFQPAVRPAVVAGVGVALFSQITGISAIIYYAPSLLELSGFGESASTLGSVGVGVVLTVFTVLGIYLVERWGRRKLVVFGLPGAVVALAVMALMLPWSSGSPEALGSGGQAVVITCLLAYFAFNGGSLSVVAWLYFAEIFPLRVRGKGTSLTALVLWITNFLVTLLLYFAADRLGVGLVFGVLALFNILAWVFALRRMAETKGRTLEEIEASLHDGTFASHGRPARTP
ncbi:sugar porter family MFS transporter [Streptomyces sp. NPDC091271]|uniref:sugar porter family MFS transporter n=1 Tax=Streptomyces sp. NPDC091271 TaxID=3365980 RepID=UPI0038130D5D